MEAEAGVDFGVGTGIAAAIGAPPVGESGAAGAPGAIATAESGTAGAPGAVATAESGTAAAPGAGATAGTTTTTGLEAELIARARLICGERWVLTDPAVVETYRRYASGLQAPAPLVVVLPGRASEVAGLVGACSALSLGWTVRGAATSTDGSALPQAGSALIVLTRMRRILRPLNADGEITVEPGVSIAMLRNLCGESVLPGADLNATVGGYVASVRGLRGVNGIEIVEPDGSVAHTEPRQPGYDLAGAFCGSRGLTGIAVAISLQAGDVSIGLHARDVSISRQAGDSSGRGALGP